MRNWSTSLSALRRRSLRLSTESPLTWSHDRLPHGGGTGATLGRFLIVRKINGLCSYFVLDASRRTNIFVASRSVKGRAASVFVAWQRDAVVRHDAGLQTPTGITILESAWGTHAGNTGRRPKCRSGRQFARTGSVGSSDKPWDMQQAVKSIVCGTQANTASVVGSAWKRVGPGPVCRLRSGVREPVCRLRKGIRALACKCGRRGRGYSPSRSAQPLGATDGEEKATTKRQALWPT